MPPEILPRGGNKEAYLVLPADFPPRKTSSPPPVTDRRGRDLLF